MKQNIEGLVVEGVIYQYGIQCFTYNLTVNRGQCLGLIGPSGSGKSTLLALIAGFIQPQSGHIYVNGLLIDNLSVAKRPISLIFQDYNLFSHLTIADNVALGLNGKLNLTAQQWQQVDAVLQAVDLSGLEKRLPQMLSGGQRSRAALARALLRSRPVLLLDEPLAALGPAQRQQMLQLLHQLKTERQLTLIIVSHQPDEISQLCEQLAFLEQGQIIWQGTSQTLTTEILPTALRDYLGK